MTWYNLVTYKIHCLSSLSYSLIIIVSSTIIITIYDYYRCHHKYGIMIMTVIYITTIVIAIIIIINTIILNTATHYRYHHPPTRRIPLDGRRGDAREPRPQGPDAGPPLGQGEHPCPRRRPLSRDLVWAGGGVGGGTHAGPQSSCRRSVLRG